MGLPWWLNLEWKSRRRFMLTLCAIEFPLTVAGLTLYGVAAPNTYRTKLWAFGSQMGYNSDPSEILYSYANYAPINPPLVWSQGVTNYMVIVSIMSMFILLGKTVMYITEVFPPLLSLIVHAGSVAVWTYGAYQLASPDMTDPLHPSPTPWFLSKGCHVVSDPTLYGYCLQAQTCFAIALVFVILFTTYTLLSLYSAIPNKTQIREAHEKKDIELAEKAEWDYFKNMAKPAFEAEENMQCDSPMIPTSTKKTGVFTPRKLSFSPLSPLGLGRERKAPSVDVSEVGSASGGASTSGNGNGKARANRELPLRQHIALNSLGK